MIQTITAGVHFVYTVIYYCFYFSYRTGQFLVISTNLLLQSLLTIIKNLLEVLIIILESFTIFCHDVAQDLQHILKILSNVVEVIQGGVSTALCSVINTVDTLALSVAALFDFIVNIMLSVVTGIGHIFVFLKRVLVLFGSGIWFSITFIPLLIVYIGTLVIYYMGKMLEEIIQSISKSILTARVLWKQIYDFLTDIPIESVAGILVATCLLYIFTQFYIIICSYVYQQIQNAFRNIHRRYCRMRRHRMHNTLVVQRQRILRTRTSPRSRPQIRSELNSPQSPKNENTIDERYCVICQERIKCILILPCRHVCMCNECNVRLQLYNNTCPICRNDIESTMKIFV